MSLHGMDRQAYREMTEEVFHTSNRVSSLPYQRMTSNWSYIHLQMQCNRMYE